MLASQNRDDQSEVCSFDRSKGEEQQISTTPQASMAIDWSRRRLSGKCLLRRVRMTPRRLVAVVVTVIPCRAVTASPCVGSKSLLHHLCKSRQWLVQAEPSLSLQRLGRVDGSVAWKGGRWGGGEGGRAEVGWESDSRGRTHTRNLEEGASKER